MAILTRTELIKSEFIDSLEFQLEREMGWFEPLEALITLPVGYWFYLQADRLLYRILVVLVFASWLANTVARWAQGRTTTLLVRADGVVARGSLGNLFSTETSVAVGDVSAIGFDPGGEGSESCIFVSYHLGRETLLPDISSNQAQCVLEAIANKFPSFPVVLVGESGFGIEGKTISLGLSKLNRNN